MSVLQTRHDAIEKSLAKCVSHNVCFSGAQQARGQKGEKRQAVTALACRARLHRDAAIKRACRVLAARTGTDAAIQQRKSRRNRAHAGTSGMWNGNGIWRCAASKSHHHTSHEHAKLLPRPIDGAVAFLQLLQVRVARKKRSGERAVYCGSKRALPRRAQGGGGRNAVTAMRQHMRRRSGVGVRSAACL